MNFIKSELTNLNSEKYTTKEQTEQLYGVMKNLDKFLKNGRRLFC